MAPLQNEHLLILHLFEYVLREEDVDKAVYIKKRILV